jgi:hypothetical protein
VNAVGGNRGDIELTELDIPSPDSVRICADALVDDGKPFDLVIAQGAVGERRGDGGRAVLNGSPQ